MHSKSLERKLHSLMRLEARAAEACRDAAAVLAEGEVRDVLARYCAVHLERLEILRDALLRRGIEVGPPGPGFDRKRFTSLAGMSASRSLLEALRTSETLTLTYYREAARGALPKELEQAFQKAIREETAHLSYIDARLEGHPPEVLDPAAREGPSDACAQQPLRTPPR